MWRKFSDQQLTAVQQPAHLADTARRHAREAPTLANDGEGGAQIFLSFPRTHMHKICVYIYYHHQLRGGNCSHCDATVASKRTD